MSKKIQVTVTLDVDNYTALVAISTKYEDNLSYALRHLLNDSDEIEAAKVLRTDKDSED